jgi:hypothetical protein
LGQEHTPQVVVKIEGARAGRGVLLGDLREFLGDLTRALRDYDRYRHGVEMRTPGHPNTRAAAVSAIRLVDFTTGSAVLTIES